jgi:hypothetical protein
MHGVLGCTEECLDAKVLLNPLEEDLDLPTGLVELSDRFWSEREVVGQKYESLVCCRISEGDSAKLFRIIVARCNPCKRYGLIGDDTGASVDLVRVNPASFIFEKNE